MSQKWNLCISTNNCNVIYTIFKIYAIKWKQIIPYVLNSSKNRVERSKTEAKSIPLTHIYMTDQLSWIGTDI